MMHLRVLIADDHALARAGLRCLLEQLPQIEVIGDTGADGELLELVNSRHPNVVLMNLMMTGLNGLETCRRIAVDFSKTKVIVFSMRSDEEQVAEALQAGVLGYLSKGAGRSELQLALEAAGKGETYLSPRLSRRAHLKRTTERFEPLNQLSARQREIMQLVAEGNTTKEIAFLLNISTKTVETHRAELMRRLSIRDVPGLVRCAIRTGLVSSAS
jgi:DNA-binding NarL/FixJ family response regulator